MLKSFLHQFKNVFDLGNSRIGALDGLRTLAILMVFNVHFFAFYAANHYFADADGFVFKLIGTLRAGHIGVDLFFVISGYLIYKSLRGRPLGLTFFKKRMFRLLPAHLALCVVIVIVKDIPSLSFTSFLLNVLFLTPVISDQSHLLNFVTWSLTWEWAFYVCIFIAVAAAARSDFRVFLITLLLTVGVPFVMHQFFDPNFFLETGRFAGFSLGVMLVWLQSNHSRQMNSMRWNALAIAAFGGIILLQILWFKGPAEIQALPLQGGFYLLASFLFMVIIQAATVEGTWVQRVFVATPLQFIGKISYSFYLVHPLVIVGVLNRLPAATSLQDVIGNYSKILSITIVAASLMYYYLEKPYFSRAVVNPKRV